MNANNTNTFEEENQKKKRQKNIPLGRSRTADLSITRFFQLQSNVINQLDDQRAWWRKNKRENLNGEKLSSQKKMNPLGRSRTADIQISNSQSMKINSFNKPLQSGAINQLDDQRDSC